MVISGKTSSNNKYSKLCHQFFADQYQFIHNLLTTSCADALEMAAILSQIGLGDEVIMPNYTLHDDRILFNSDRYTD